MAFLVFGSANNPSRAGRRSLLLVPALFAAAGLQAQRSMPAPPAPIAGSPTPSTVCSVVTPQCGGGSVADTTAVGITFSAAPHSAGGSVSLDAAVTDTTHSADIPTGMVTFYDTPPGGTKQSIGSQNLNGLGKATINEHNLLGGNHTIEVTYQSNNTTNYANSSRSVTLAVGDAIALVNSNGLVTYLNGSGVATTSNIGVAGTASTLGGIAVDNSGQVWSVTSANNQLGQAPATGTSPSSFTDSSLQAPASIAIDGGGNVWVADSGNNSVSLFSNSGAVLSPSSGLAAGSLSTPAALAIDQSGDLWVANASSVSKIFGVATPVVAPLATAVANVTLGSIP